jgi:hypothetical protein
VLKVEKIELILAGTYVDGYETTVKAKMIAPQIFVSAFVTDS